MLNFHRSQNNFNYLKRCFVEHNHNISLVNKIVGKPEKNNIVVFESHQ